jgi:hypothetical protein
MDGVPRFERLRHSMGLWHASRTAIEVAYGLASLFTLQGASVVTMGAIMLVRKDPTASTGLVYARAYHRCLAVLTVALLRSYAAAGSKVHATSSPVGFTRETRLCMRTRPGNLPAYRGHHRYPAVKLRLKPSSRDKGPAVPRA